MPFPLFHRHPSPQLLENVARYIDRCLTAPEAPAAPPVEYCAASFAVSSVAEAAPRMAAMPAPELEDLLEQLDAGFSQTLLAIIDSRGLKDSAVYKKAQVDRKLFSKIRTHPDYRPSKGTALAFALALELDLEETESLIGRAGYALTHSSKFDIIVEYFILHGNYDLFELNEVLCKFDQPLIPG